MKTLKHIVLLVVMLTLTTTTVNAQKTSKADVKKADKIYSEFEYANSSKMLQRIVEGGNRTTETLSMLANSYYFNNQMEQASRWYGELMSLDQGNINPEYYFRYAMTLKAQKKYDDADIWMGKFVTAKGQDLRAKEFTSTRDYLSQIEANSRIDLAAKNVRDLNSKYSDFGTAYYDGDIIFASSRPRPDKKKDIYGWNDQPFLDLYKANQKDTTGLNFGGIKNFSNKVNTELHESSVAFAIGDSVSAMYFTRNNFFKNRFRKDDNGVNRLQLYRVNRNDNRIWENAHSVHFNSDQYSVAHPTINPTANRIYFASDMGGIAQDDEGAVLKAIDNSDGSMVRRGTYGEADLYYADIYSDGTLGEPVNLGDKVNKEAADTFPFMNSKGDLFFASESYPGLGGLDIFVIRNFETQHANGGELKVENLGEPFNSQHDDFAYFENLKTGQVYFSSNRPGGLGDDDIYTVEKVDVNCGVLADGVVRNKRTGELIPHARVTLTDGITGEQLGSMVVGEDAYFKFPVECGRDYLVKGEKTNHTPDEKRFSTPTAKEIKTELKLDLGLDLDLDLDLDLALDDNPYKIAVGDNLAEIFDIPIIYFDFNKSYIRPEAARDLQIVINVLRRYPDMHIDVKSHTDSRATASYNQSLSQRRNEATRAYIIQQGIDASRITGRGYGESQIKNGCTDGVPCSEEEHQANRRSEFIVTKCSNCRQKVNYLNNQPEVIDPKNK